MSNNYSAVETFQIVIDIHLSFLVCLFDSKFDSKCLCKLKSVVNSCEVFHLSTKND